MPAGSHFEGSLVAVAVMVDADGNFAFKPIVAYRLDGLLS
jgi:hypothetical protein